MTQKYISVVTLAFAGAVTAFAQITLNSVPSRSIGSPALNISSLSPNLVEGREFWNPQAVALDTSVSPPILYVSDTNNHRVLAWKNASTFVSGQKADLAVGQPNLATTFAAGPNSPSGSPGHNTSGLNTPTGIAVDKQGNLYVADSGNNRILRYPKPFQSSTQYPLPDLWIGQTGSSPASGTAHCGSGQVSAQGLCLATSSASGIAFDSSGNLWMTDPGNSRVLRFPASQLAIGGGGLSADLAIGQPNASTVQTALPNTSASLLSLTQFFVPGSLGFDSNGNLFVTDVERVLVFQPQFASGMSASPHIIGVFAANYTLPTGATALQALVDQTAVYNPRGLFFLPDGTIGVVDSGTTISNVSVGNRIVVFSAFASWPTNGAPPSATLILGQPATCTQFPNQLCKAVNNGSPWPSANTFANPGGVAWNATDLYIADTGNNRVLDLPLPLTAQSTATRVLGQDPHNGNFDTSSVDLVEGREFEFQNVGSTGTGDAGIAIDTISSVPHLYVSDPGNNRVLGFKDLRNLQPGAKADIVIGQPDMQTAMCNYHAPADTATGPTSRNLCRPIGLVVDPVGNLYVADSLNGRVLRFPAPFGPNGSNGEAADLVLGQQNFTATIPDVTATNMALPYGLAFSPACNPRSLPCTPNGLVVSDQYDSRVLYIPMTNGTFTAGIDNGKAATVVFGQTTFDSAQTGSDPTSMNSPHHVACDSSGLVYVADTGNNRVLVFNDPNASTTAHTGAQGFPITGLNGPQGVFVSAITGEIWIANTNSFDAVHYANFSLLGNSPLPDNVVELSGGYDLRTLAVAQDQFGALYVADQGNRVAFYYPGLNLCNGASFLEATASAAPNMCAAFDSSNGVTLNAHPLAPGVVATIFPCGQQQGSTRNCPGDQFLDQTAAFSGQYPMPTRLVDVEVMFNGVAAPLYYVGAPAPNTANSSGQINFVVPNGAPTSGTADVEVIQASTGRVLGATLVPMAPASPGIFICLNSPTMLNDPNAVNRWACVLNQDNSVNGPNNPAARGSYISIYATGQGYVPNAPADGTPATGPIPAPAPLTVYLGGTDVNGYGEAGQHIQYSGLDGFPGIWQVNVLIPQEVSPSSQTGGVTALNLIVGGTVANIDPGEGEIVSGVLKHWNTVIAVK